MSGKKRAEYKKVQAVRVPKGDSIEERPEAVDNQEEPFHWEMDSVLSAKESGRISTTAIRTVPTNEGATRTETV